MGTLIAGNWKMNGTREDAATFVERMRALRPEMREGRSMLICPPATLLADLAAPLAELGLSVGGQNCHHAEKGPFTGEISAAMLRDLGASHVIVGHSERRTQHDESDGLVRAKAMAAWRRGLVPIVCVGESLAERESGRAAAVVRKQVELSIPEELAGNALAVAYEPLWAIGTGLTATQDDIESMHCVIHDTLTNALVGARHTPILYGGSVKASNAAQILALDLVDGVLLGRASQDADHFMRVADAIG